MSSYQPAPLPVSNPTSSYWLSQPHPVLENFCSGGELPSHADTVIIGSGITGALIAHQLFARSPNANGKRVVMLEARSVTSGATGRNGGHIKPDCYKNFATFQKRHGSEMAKMLCRYELENMKESAQFIIDHGLDDAVDLVKTHAVDIFMDEKAWEDAQHSLKLYREAGGDLSEITVHDQAQSEQKFRFKGVLGAVSYPACSLWPYKLAVGLIERAVSDGLQLFTNTPAVAISPAPNGKWHIETNKCRITCDRIFHATNAYISKLVPDFAGKIVPVKGNVVAIEPGSGFSSQPLDHTCSIQWGSDFDYMIQRPTDGKPFIFGGGDLAHPRKLAGPFGDADDSTTTPEIVDALLQFPAKYMKGWGDKASARVAWSGIMGFTADDQPFIGELPGRTGQFVAAGYTGHGMARVFLAAKALVRLAHNEAVDPRVPGVYFDIETRLKLKDEEWDSILKEGYSGLEESRSVPLQKL
ncbi:FAD dependent oxidoreductase [Ilyonectria sp. MPI-CAGE-AT-0026]|nr:FAD dependent oxidoreductase [Ilyonectria sp. MPI-CAGE-AT-0026]